MLNLDDEFLLPHLRAILLTLAESWKLQAKLKIRRATHQLTNMKYFLLLTLFIIGKFSLVQCQSTNKVKQPDTTTIQVPRVYLLYFKNGTPFDRDWTRITKLPIKDEWMQETGRRLSEFQSTWNQEGAKYLQTVFAEIGIPFPYIEIQATLTVATVASSSTPLIINVKPFLSSAEKPASMSVFPIILFHELMHIYLRGVTDSSSLRKKYAKESFVTLNHLHLMALEKFVLLKTGETATLQWLDHDYRTGDFPPDYKRAWEIINDIEGYQTFVNELKLMSANKAK